MTLPRNGTRMWIIVCMVIVVAIQWLDARTKARTEHALTKVLHDIPITQAHFDSVATVNQKIIATAAAVSQETKRKVVEIIRAQQDTKQAQRLAEINKKQDSLIGAVAKAAKRTEATQDTITALVRSIKQIKKETDVGPVAVDSLKSKTAK